MNVANHFSFCGISIKAILRSRLEGLCSSRRQLLMWLFEITELRIIIEWMESAINLLRHRQTKDGKRLFSKRHSGKTYFEMEKPGKPSRWNILRALRVLNWWEGAALPVPTPTPSNQFGS